MCVCVCVNSLQRKRPKATNYSLCGGSWGPRSHRYLFFSPSKLSPPPPWPIRGGYFGNFVGGGGGGGGVGQVNTYYYIYVNTYTLTEVSNTVINAINLRF